MLNFLLALSLLCLSSVPATANDTAAEVIGGNVVFQKVAGVEMVSESLEISPDEVKVDYAFSNLTDRPIETLVDFPLAELHSESPLAVPMYEWFKGGDPLHFRLWVDGKERPVKVIVSKRKQDGTPIRGSVPEDESFYFQVHYTWRQVFPPHTSTKISHRYIAALGSGGGVQFEPREIRDYCMEPAFLKAFERFKAHILKTRPEARNEQVGGMGAYMHFHSFGWFSYILKTANNWAGPIGRFRLKINKGSADNLVSLCWDGLKKVSPTEFVFEKTDFVPTSDLKILFLKADDNAQSRGPASRAAASKADRK